MNSLFVLTGVTSNNYNDEHARPRCHTGLLLQEYLNELVAITVFFYRLTDVLISGGTTNFRDNIDHAVP